MKQIFFILSVLLTYSLSAQQTLSTAGGNASGSGGNASYTVGQVVYTTITGSTGNAVQGVQQPFEISVITALKEAKGIALECTVYPNPSAGLIYLRVENYETQDLYYQLLDYNGTILQKRKTDGSQTLVRMEELPAGIYFLKVTETGKEIKTFKIIKN